MRVALATALICLALPACHRAPVELRVTAEDAVVRLSPIPGRPASAYFTLRTNNDPTQLTGVTSPNAERIEMHESRTKGGISRMSPVDRVSFSDVIEFKPGARHLMLFGLDPALKPGDTIPLTFTFLLGEPVTVKAQVEGFGGSHAPH